MTTTSENRWRKERRIELGKKSKVSSTSIMHIWVSMSYFCCCCCIFVPPHAIRSGIHFLYVSFWVFRHPYINMHAVSTTKGNIERFHTHTHSLTHVHTRAMVGNITRAYSKKCILKMPSPVSIRTKCAALFDSPPSCPMRIYARVAGNGNAHMHVLLQRIEMDIFLWVMMMNIDKSDVCHVALVMCYTYDSLLHIFRLPATTIELYIHNSQWQM